jgi:hypothetical protein
MNTTRPTRFVPPIGYWLLAIGYPAIGYPAIGYYLDGGTTDTWSLPPSTVCMANNPSFFSAKNVPKYSKKFHPSPACGPTTSFRKCLALNAAGFFSLKKSDKK